MEVVQYHLWLQKKPTSFPWKILRLGYKSPPTIDNGRHQKDVGSSKISISKKHLKFIKTTNPLQKKPDPLQKDLGRQQLVGEEWSRGIIPHTYQQRISAHVALTGKGHRSGSSARKLCSWVRQLLFPLCFLQMACSDSAILCHCQAECLPQNHPTTLCHTPHSCVLNSSISTHHR